MGWSKPPSLRKWSRDGERGGEDNLLDHVDAAPVDDHLADAPVRALVGEAAFLEGLAGGQRRRYAGEAGERAPLAECGGGEARGGPPRRQGPSLGLIQRIHQVRSSSSEAGSALGCKPLKIQSLKTMGDRNVTKKPRSGNDARQRPNSASCQDETRFKSTGSRGSSTEVGSVHVRRQRRSSQPGVPDAPCAPPRAPPLGVTGDAPAAALAAVVAAPGASGVATTTIGGLASQRSAAALTSPSEMSA